MRDSAEEEYIPTMKKELEVKESSFIPKNKPTKIFLMRWENKCFS